LARGYGGVMSTEITVRGSFTVSQQPERGTVHASISYEGAELEPVYDHVARDLETVKASVAPLHDAERGPVTRWSAEQLRTWSRRPWNDDGEQLPFVHHANVDVAVKFLDFQALSRWVGEHTAGTEGFRVSSIEWALTKTRQDELSREVRSSAVKEAVTRAQQYADALGLGQVSPLALSDVGMLKAEAHFVSAQPRAMSAAHGGPDVELVPRDIEVSAEVDARFLAEPR
jgi:uncharacterized protein